MLHLIPFLEKLQLYQYYYIYNLFILLLFVDPLAPPKHLSATPIQQTDMSYIMNFTWDSSCQTYALRTVSVSCSKNHKL